jgi:hypothetical protein
VHQRLVLDQDGRTPSDHLVSGRLRPPVSTTHSRNYAGEDILPPLYRHQGVSGNFVPPPPHVEVTEGEEILASSEHG